MNIPHRGPFLFENYGTTGIRITCEEDGIILPRTYSYWPNINAHRGRDIMRVFLGTDRGPCWWEIDKCNYQVSPMGPLPVLQNSTAEGWYWDRHNPDILYCSDDKHLYRYNIEEQNLETVVDITPFQWGGEFALRQWHTSDNRVHSATVKRVIPDGSWPNIGTIVYDENAPQCQSWKYYPKIGVGDLDEAQIDKSGCWLLIKENLDGADGEDNRIIYRASGAERHLMDRDGAAGHSDSGFGYMIAADNWQNQAAWRLWRFDPDFEPQGLTVLVTPWEAQVLHVSHCNARRGNFSSQIALGSGTIPDLWLFSPSSLSLDGFQTIRAIAPSMSAGSDYDNLPKANIDPHGLFALWTCQRNGRFDAFMVKI
jgi:hypothetical protein